MTGREVVVLATGVANVASVAAAWGRLGIGVRYSMDAGDVANASHLVLPGVGAFGAGMAALTEHGLVESLRERILGGRPTLAICLGLQLLFETSEETPGVSGIGVLQGAVTRFSSAVRVPQLGWNEVAAGDDSVVPTGYAYFANSFCVRSAPAGYRVAWCDYDGRFVAACERDGVVACQFHPELSGAYGERLLKRWFTRGEGAR
jgi:imidazole glycerol phosphate synthase glutamine amidotransferase subunit